MWQKSSTDFCEWLEKDHKAIVDFFLTFLYYLRRYCVHLVSQTIDI